MTMALICGLRKGAEGLYVKVKSGKTVQLTHEFIMKNFNSPMQKKFNGKPCHFFVDFGAQCRGIYCNDCD